MNRISIVFGSQFFRNTSSKVNAFVYPTDGGKSVFPSTVLASMAKTIRTAASRDGYQEHGYWNRHELAAIEGTILGIRFTDSQGGAIRANSMLMLRLREDADLLSITARASHHRDAVYNGIPVFTGNADVITHKEAIELGVKFPQGILNSCFDADEIEEDFEVEVLKKGEDAPTLQKVHTASGETKTVALKGEKPRRLRIRRKK